MSLSCPKKIDESLLLLLGAEVVGMALCWFVCVEQLGRPLGTEGWFTGFWYVDIFGCGEGGFDEDQGQCVRDESSADRSRLSGVHHVREIAK